MGKKSTWFLKEWLAYWQVNSTSSRWHRGRTISQQKQRVDVHISAGKVRTSMKGSEIYQQEIRCSPLDSAQREQIKNLFIEQPSLIMKIYTKEMHEAFAEIACLSSLLSIPPLHLSCTCPDEVVPCKHLVASAFAVGEVFEENPYQYVIFRGIPWEEVLANLQPKANFISGGDSAEKVKYSMVPLPASSTPAPAVNRWKTTPPFWTSSFPFPLIMEEIHTKVEETEEEDTEDIRK